MSGTVPGMRRCAWSITESLPQVPPRWRDQVRVVAIDMCAIYLSAVRSQASRSTPCERNVRDRMFTF
jgi:hypothetical protein